MHIILTLVAQVPMRRPSIALLLHLISLMFLKQQVTTLHFDSLPLFGGTQCHILVFWILEVISVIGKLFPELLLYS